MAPRQHSGFLSFVFGALSIPIEAVVKHLTAARNPGAAEFLNWLDRMGFVRQGVPDSVHTIGPSPIITFTDESALQVAEVFGLYLAAAAVLFALWAEYKREDSLLLAGGLVFGCLSLLLYSANVGISAMVTCAAVVAVLRSRADA